MSTLSQALEVLRLQSLHDEYLQHLVENFMTFPERVGFEFLETIGMYESSVAFMPKDLDFLFKSIGSLPECALAFALATFDQDINKFNFYWIGHKLKHPLYENVRSELRKRVLKQLLANSSLNREIDPLEIEAIIPGNYGNNAPIPKSRLFAIAKDLDRQKPCSIDSAGKMLAIKITSTCEELARRYPTVLFQLDFSDEEVVLLRKMVVGLFTGAIRNQNLFDFLSAWDKGGLIFISCCLFAKDSDKDTNTDFWNEYYRWLGFEIPNEFTYSQVKINREIKEFWDVNGVRFVTSRSGNNQYVMTFLMHSIISNRPLSIRVAVRFLIKIIKGDGTVYHDSDDQRELLESHLKEFSSPLIDSIESDSSSPVYLQLPRETALAFFHNPGQVVDFLLPIYDSLEKQLIDLVNQEFGILEQHSTEIPVYLKREVENALQSTSIEEIKRIRSVLKTFRKGRASLYLDVKNPTIQIHIPQYFFTDLRENSEINFTLYDTDGAVQHIQNGIHYEVVQSMAITDGLEFPCAKVDKSMIYEFTCDGMVLAKGTVPACRLFDIQGGPLSPPYRTAQYVYCIAKPDTIISDIALQEIHSNILEDFSLWASYLSDESPILIEDVLYVVDEGVVPNKAGCNLHIAPYRDVRFLFNSSRYSVIGSYPTFFLRLQQGLQVENEIMIAVNGNNVPYSVLSNNNLHDGTNEAFIRLAIDPQFPFENGKLLNIRLFSRSKMQDVLSISVFALKNLSFSFSKDFYSNVNEVVLNNLIFDEQEKLFSGHYYVFPDSRTRFKLALEDYPGSRLELLPPVITVTQDGKNLVNEDCWYTNISDSKNIVVEGPKDITSVHLSTRDSKDIKHHELKRKGGGFDVKVLRSYPETEEACVLLTLSAINKNKQNITIPICKVYYRVFLKTQVDQIFFYVPPSENIRFANFKPGLKVDLSFYCDRRNTYTVNLMDMKKKIIASFPIEQDSRANYYQPTDLIPGQYNLLVFEKKKNQISGETTSREVFNLECPYKNNASIPHGKFPSPSLVKEPRMVANRSLEIRVLYAVKRIINPGNTSTYKPYIKIISFYLLGMSSLYVGASFEAIGYFTDRSGKRYEMSQFNPFIVTVIHRGRDKNMIIKVVDNDNQHLKINARNGHVNPLHTAQGDRLHAFTFFEATEV